MSDYEVGYGKPPVGTRFQKGHSGNPKGRPRKALDLVALVEEEMCQLVTVKEQGVSRRITKGHAMVKQLVNKGASGDARMARLLLTLLGQSQGLLPPEPEGGITTEADQEVIQGILTRLYGKPAPGGEARHEG